MLRAILIVLVALGLVHGKSLTVVPEYEKELVASLDTSVNPCDDFYNFTCNKMWPPNGDGISSMLHKIDSNIGNEMIHLLMQARNDESAPEAVRKAAYLYTTCLDYPGDISSEAQLLDHLGPSRRQSSTFIKEKKLKYKAYNPAKLKRCMTRVSNGMKYATDYLYNVYGRNEPYEDEIVEMVGYLKQGFLQNIESIEWLDIKFKTYVRKLIADMKYYIGYPKWVKNVDLLNQHYSSLNLTGDWTLDIESVDMMNNDRESNEIPINNGWDWYLEPSTIINAYYYPSTNVFQIPTAMTRAPMYDPQRPNYINYGTLGYIIAHEMTHSVDAIRNDNWTSLATMEYNKRKECLVKQYESMPTEGDPMNGTVTINDNVADNGAIHHIYQAYHSWVKATGYRPVTPYYTADQFLYIGVVLPWCTTRRDHYSSGSTHSPNHIRFLVPLMNSEEFSSAYRCNPDDYMARQNMCRIW